MKLYDFVCHSCSEEWEDYLDKDDILPPCPECGSNEDVEKILSIGGYFIHGDNDASTRPRHSGAFIRRKKK